MLTPLVPLLVMAPPAAADVIELRSGQRIEGTLRQASPAGVVLEVGGQSRTFEANDVRAIYFTATAPRPAAAPAGPATAPAGADTWSSLKALRAAAAGGASPPDYGARAGEIRAAVERYLASLPNTAAPGVEALREAMHYYQLADFAWRNHSAVSDRVWLKQDEALDRCHGYQDFVQAMRAKGESHYSERTRTFFVISDGVLAVLWSCAADRLAEAERVLTSGLKP